ncbi:unnamed protein product [Caenorhabditis auriculariae]|uniref:Uncharacterized protein n=1 Tax=Caenorhabditis auriculariae TaxID=2777116 RepID=A0A8S1H2C8_9PELO|nr:unnamed protein product [Caenorhabditis auriculariae]
MAQNWMRLFWFFGVHQQPHHNLYNPYFDVYFDQICRDSHKKELILTHKGSEYDGVGQYSSRAGWWDERHASSEERTPLLPPGPPPQPWPLTPRNYQPNRVTRSASTPRQHGDRLNHVNSKTHAISGVESLDDAFSMPFRSQ